ncbi:MAG: rod shape-determining protein MreD [Planctomycetota bacterium]|jgi:rod shape-determining protein MreD|nr:rod shape-determining protein MreD [Planctomycetota bacterium]
MKWFRFLVLLSVALVVQRSFGDRMEVYGSRPDFVLILALHLSLCAGSGLIFGAQWVAGLARDLFGIGVLGLSACLFPLLGTLASRLGRDLYAHHPLTRLVLSFLVALQVELTFSFVLFLKAEHLDLFSLFAQGFGSAIYTALVALILYRLLDMWPALEARTR